MFPINFKLLALSSGAALWLVAIVVGISTAINYQAAAGSPSTRTLTTWPATSRISPSSITPTLLMFVHPNCPCSRASMNELERLMANVDKNVITYVVFVRSAGLIVEPNETELWDKASRIPGTILISDDFGVEAEIFGAQTSGQTYLYGTDGKLIFQGGITASRGHEGANDGRSAIENLINSGSSPLDESAVYGCQLLDRSDDCRHKLGGHR